MTGHNIKPNGKGQKKKARAQFMLAGECVFQMMVYMQM